MGGHGALGVVLEGGALVVVSYALECLAKPGLNTNLGRVVSHRRYLLRKAIAPRMHLQSILNITAQVKL